MVAGKVMLFLTILSFTILKIAQKLLVIGENILIPLENLEYPNVKKFLEMHIIIPLLTMI